MSQNAQREIILTQVRSLKTQKEAIQAERMALTSKVNDIDALIKELENALDAITPKPNKIALDTLLAQFKGDDGKGLILCAITPDSGVVEVAKLTNMSVEPSHDPEETGWFELYADIEVNSYSKEGDLFATITGKNIETWKGYETKVFIPNLENALTVLVSYSRPWVFNEGSFIEAKYRLGTLEETVSDGKLVEGITDWIELPGEDILSDQIPNFYGYGS